MEDTKNYKFGNKTEIPQGTAGSSVDGQYFLYAYNNYIERAFITALRAAFSHNATPEKFRYNEDINLSQVDIRSDYPHNITKLPIIVVTLGGGNANMTYVGDELLRQATVETDGVNGYLYGGIMTLSVQIEILAGSKRDIEHLSDLVTVYMRFLFKKKFYEQNMAYTEVTNTGISTKEDVTGSIKTVFENTIGTKITSEFSGFIDKELYETISGLNFTIGTYF